MRVVAKYFVVHPDVAIIPGLAACAAHRQGKYEPMYKAIFEKGFAQRDLSQPKMEALAEELGLNMDKFRADMGGPDCQKWVNDGGALLSSLGAGGTPAFFINGRFLGGAQPLGNFKRVIDEELKKADAAIAAGTPADRYYEEAVVKKGKRTR